VWYDFLISAVLAVVLEQFKDSAFLTRFRPKLKKLRDVLNKLELG
jgi:hypothetical protein